MPEPRKGSSMDCMVPAPVLRLLEHNPSANVVLVSKADLTRSTRILQCSCLRTASQYWMFGTGWCVATFPPLSLCRVKKSQSAWGWASSELLHYFPVGRNCWTTVGPKKKKCLLQTNIKVGVRKILPTQRWTTSSIVI